MLQLPAYQQVNQAGSLSTMKPVNPASKQANRSISFSGATGMGPSNATKQRATVLHHFPSERPSRPQPLITRLCQSAGLQHTSLFTALCYSLLPLYHHYASPVCRRRVLFQLSGGVNKRGQGNHKLNRLWKAYFHRKKIKKERRRGSFLFVCNNAYQVWWIKSLEQRS